MGRQKWAKDRQFNNSLDEFKSQSRSQRKKVLSEEKIKNCFLLCFQDIQDKRFMKETILSITVPVSYGTARNDAAGSLSTSMIYSQSRKKCGERRQNPFLLARFQNLY